MARKGSGFLNGPVPRKASVAGAAGLMMAKSALFFSDLPDSFGRITGEEAQRPFCSTLFANLDESLFVGPTIASDQLRSRFQH